jgi:hypothetical protein
VFLILPTHQYVKEFRRPTFSSADRWARLTHNLLIKPQPQSLDRDLAIHLRPPSTNTTEGRPPPFSCSSPAPAARPLPPLLSACPLPPLLAARRSPLAPYNHCDNDDEVRDKAAASSPVQSGTRRPHRQIYYPAHPAPKVGLRRVSRPPHLPRCSRRYHRGRRRAAQALLHPHPPRAPQVCALFHLLILPVATLI